MCEVWAERGEAALAIQKVEKHLPAAPGSKYGWVDQLSDDDWRLLRLIWSDDGLEPLCFGIPDEAWEQYKRAYEVSARRSEWDLSATVFFAGRRRQALSAVLEEMSRNSDLPFYSAPGLLSTTWRSDVLLAMCDARQWAATWGFELTGVQDAASDEGGSGVAPPASHPATAETPRIRQARRLKRFAELGGLMKPAGSSWHCSGRKGALADLIREEKAARRPMADKTNVRRDLGAAMGEQRRS
jgi:hypothetical protein